MTSNNNEKDINPPLSLEYGCCTPEIKTVDRNIHLELPLKSLVNRLEDLKLASHKVEELDKIISEQEWIIKQSRYNSHLSLSYIGMFTTSLVMFILSYCCCCKCNKRFPNFSKW